MQRRDRRHYQLHQHVESIGAGRRSLVAEEGCRARANLQALGEDQPCTGIESGDGLFERGRLAACARALKFNLVGYGCTTCIGNSGPLPEEVAAGVTKEKLTVAAVLSGNRNF